MEDRPFFLEPQFIVEGCRSMEVPVEIATQACRLARRIQADAPLRAAAVEAHRRLYHERKPIAPCPKAGALRGAEGLFHWIVLLSGFPRMREVHARRAIPAAVVRETLSDVRLHLESYHAGHGHPGLDINAVNWLVSHMRGELYRLGRLQFMFGAFAHPYVAYRHRTQRRLVVLAENGKGFRADGQLNGAGGVVATAGLWCSRFQESEKEVRGNPIDPATGGAMRQTVRLRKREWERVLGMGDACLDIHIPEGEPLTPEACRRAFQQALDFFPEHFPDKPFKAFVCVSWLCDAQLESWLPPSSNIVRWLRQFYLFPVPSDAWSALRSVFGCDIPYNSRENVDLSVLPRATSLQRALLNHLENGGCWRKSGALLFPEDMPQRGREIYHGSLDILQKSSDPKSCHYEGA